VRVPRHPLVPMVNGVAQVRPWAVHGMQMMHAVDGRSRQSQFVTSFIHATRPFVIFAQKVCIHFINAASPTSKTLVPMTPRSLCSSLFVRRNRWRSTAAINYRSFGRFALCRCVRLHQALNYSRRPRGNGTLGVAQRLVPGITSTSNEAHVCDETPKTCCIIVTRLIV
jgi:hypothetical protein